MVETGVDDPEGAWGVFALLGTKEVHKSFVVRGVFVQLVVITLFKPFVLVPCIHLEDLGGRVTMEHLVYFYFNCLGVCFQILTMHIYQHIFNLG